MIKNLQNKKYSNKNLIPNCAKEIVVTENLSKPSKFCPKCKIVILKKRSKICEQCTRTMIIGEFSKGKHFVYGLYDGVDKLVYIGVTGNPMQRVHDHFKSNTKRFKTMQLIEQFTSREEAEAFESFAIYHIQPPLNVLILNPPTDWVFDFGELDRFGSCSKRARKRDIIYERPALTGR